MQIHLGTSLWPRDVRPQVSLNVPIDLPESVSGLAQALAGFAGAQEPNVHKCSSNALEGK